MRPVIANDIMEALENHDRALINGKLVPCFFTGVYDDDLAIAGSTIAIVMGGFSTSESMARVYIPGDQIMDIAIDDVVDQLERSDQWVAGPYRIVTIEDTFPGQIRCRLIRQQ